LNVFQRHILIKSVRFWSILSRMRGRFWDFRMGGPAFQWGSHTLHRTRLAPIFNIPEVDY